MNDLLSWPVMPRELSAILAEWTGWVEDGGSRPEDVPAPEASVEAEAEDSGFGVDLLHGLRNVGGNSVTYRSVLQKFVKNYRGVCDRMEQCLAQNDLEAVQHAAHTLKGVAALIGARSLSLMAREIETRVKSAMDLEGLPELLDRTSRELARLVELVEERLSRMAAPEGAPREGGGEEEESVETVEALAPLMRQAEALLVTFDSSVEKVVAQMVPLARGVARRERIRVLMEALEEYDFDECLALLRDWAKAENITLD
ncbi:MAG: Hpt domain-containing protein [Magnetococcales bacterium]|nr:Hpt domain-containing protein [Magnetococcales bacterium]